MLKIHIQQFQPKDHHRDSRGDVSDPHFHVLIMYPMYYSYLRQGWTERQTDRGRDGVRKGGMDERKEWVIGGRWKGENKVGEKG